MCTYTHSWAEDRSNVSLRSETSETNPLFRLEAKFFSLPFSHRFASKRNERRTLSEMWAPSNFFCLLISYPNPLTFFGQFTNR
jgi:hypothetical protein